MADSSSRGAIRYVVGVLVLLAAVVQVSIGVAAETTLSRPSDLGLITQVLRTGFLALWLLFLLRTPTASGVFYGLFFGFAAMFLSSLYEWVLLFHQPQPVLAAIYEWERILGAMSVTLGIALWSAERRRDDQSLRTLSATDSLTGLYNTRYFHQEIENEISRVRRYGRDLSVVLIRIDSFKAYNEKYGHSQGDNVLRDFGKSTLGYLRRSDIGCRFGANEFAVLLPETPLAGAALVGQRLLDRLHSINMEPEVGKKVQLSLSAGVVQLQPEDTSISLLRRCEQTMDKAVALGGGHIVRG